MHVAAYAERGVLHRFQASSIPAWSVFGAQMIVGLLMAVVGSEVLVVAGRAIDGASLPGQWTGALVAFVVSALSFLALGVLVAMLTRTARAAQAVGMLLFFPMFLLSGAGPPRSIMSAPMNAAAKALPLAFVVRALRDSWLSNGRNLTNHLLLATVCLIALIVTIPLARTDADRAGPRRMATASKYGS